MEINYYDYCHIREQADTTWSKQATGQGMTKMGTITDRICEGGHTVTKNGYNSLKHRQDT